MDAFIAIFRILDLVGNWFSQWRLKRQFDRQLKLENDSTAYEKLTKATNARNKNRLSRYNNSARDRPASDSMPIDKYQRD